MTANNNKGRLRFGGLIFDFREAHNSQLHIMREKPTDLPHLTINWGNPGKRINIHLTRRDKGGKTLEEKLGRIAEEDLGSALSALGHEMIPAILNSGMQIHKVRPGWLGRKGYRVAWLDEDAERQLLEIVAPTRRHHGKDERCITTEGFQNYVSMVDPDEILRHPSILHELRLQGHTTPVLAHRVFGRHRPSMIPLILKPWTNGRLSWLDLNPALRSIHAFPKERFANCLKGVFPKDAWSKIHNELALSEIGIPL